MATDIATLEKRYCNACKRQGIHPNKEIVAALFQAKIKRARREVPSLVISLDELKDVDTLPLRHLLEEINMSEIDAVDMVNRSSCVLNGENVSVLLHAVSKKLRVVDICDISFGKEFLMNLAQRGLACHVLNLRSSHFRKLNMVGSFLRMHTLNLDFSASLTSFREDCFSCMPSLKLLSLCGTRISNLWTTSSALANLPSLVELRFQNCIYCTDVDQSPGSSNESNRGVDSSGIMFGADDILPDIGFNSDDEDMSDYNIFRDVRNTDDESSDDSEVDFSGNGQEFYRAEALPDIPLGWEDLENEVYFGIWHMQNEDLFSYGSGISTNMVGSAPRSCICRHPSPICHNKHYRDYMIASLPSLKILDNLPIGNVEREKANHVFSSNFEKLPYRRHKKESVVSLLQRRESHSKLSHYCYSRSLCAAKMGSSARPSIHPLSIMDGASRDDRRNFRPRQFEYHPSDPSLMVFGTLDGEVVIINHESGKIMSYIPSLGAMSSVLGLCWLKKYPSKLIAGSDNGSLRLYDTQHMPTTSRGTYLGRGSVNFDEFDQLTSVHVNSTDELFLASGYSKHVALYDINTGRRLQIFADMHQEHINVVKFSNHSPSLFATSSFDKCVKMWDLRQKPNQPCYTASSSRGNVMACFSPDDHYILVSAVDNEVKQLLAVDGRLHLDFGIAPIGTSQNYTRSYYMCGRDYVLSGSCEERVVRICCANTGRRLRDVSLEGKSAGASMFVQSLRGDPFRDFNMSVLAAYPNSNANSNAEIVKINMLAPRDYDKSDSYTHHHHRVNGMGG